MTLRKLSITTAGIISAILILLPGAAALLFSEQALEQVRSWEKREPIPLDSLMTDASDLGDPAAWNQVTMALSDRIPLRVQLTSALRGLERDLLNRRLFDEVVSCPGPWMYYRPTLDRAPVEPERFTQALDAFRRQATDAGARFFVAPAPDKVSIYPEHLCTHRVAFDAYRQARDDLHRHFAESSEPELIDTWGPLLEAKGRADGLVYFQTDTHYNARGAVIYARTLLQAINPDAWGDAEVVFGAADQKRHDLLQLAGFSGPTEETISFQVKRPDVHAETCYADNAEIECSEAFSLHQHPIRVKVTADSGTTLIPGRTLILHDSFVEGFLKPVLWQFFEDVSYVHVSNLKAGELIAALAVYDQIVISRAERNLNQVAAWMLMPGSATQFGPRLGLNPDR